ncbi:UDP-N-acetylglucosamine--N-acetylmuramyl-(pentapeptide) pyrophosphoryl-undecaprenol N-acetylglucosamine transferase [Paenibacillus sp. J2TS4]|nr:UDP-N-acetylglucosamine--N-acetylmuramyl-(pentapeptide) pyrophosphoryl-undecaprenol N-acetylglucosamine transferase [Paenibacillus sp. J2TS4]
MFTGGGSAGHVTPNLAIIQQLKEKGWSIEYIGSKTGIEKEIIEALGDVPYHPIPSGKLRRYVDLKNLKDPFHVMQGVVKAYWLLRKLKPRIVFSKGGFVSVPVVLGSWLNRIPVIIHESDMTPGLANKLSTPFAAKVCVTFPESLKHFTGDKAVHTGPPIREELLHGDPGKGRRLCGFTSDKPVLMVMGGSLGSQIINENVRTALDRLLVRYQIVHICGKGMIDTAKSVKGYKQFEYIQDELPHVLAMADLVVSRSGSNSIFEFLALKKPMLLIPLSRQASRGDQIINAQSFEKSGFSRVLYEESLSPEALVQTVNELFDGRSRYIAAMQESAVQNSVERITELIEKHAKR